MITWLIYPIIEALIQAYWIERVKRRPDYDYLKIVRGAAFFAWAIWMVTRIEVYYDLQSYRDMLWICLPLLFWAPTTFFLIFNPLLNKLRGREWDYKGKDSGPFDKLSAKNYHRFMKACAVVAGLCLLISFKWFPLI
jgi:hypothetical protein